MYRIVTIALLAMAIMVTAAFAEFKDPLRGQILDENNTIQETQDIGKYENNNGGSEEIVEKPLIEMNTRGDSYKITNFSDDNITLTSGSESTVGFDYAMEDYSEFESNYSGSIDLARGSSVIITMDKEGLVQIYSSKTKDDGVKYEVSREKALYYLLKDYKSDGKDIKNFRIENRGDKTILKSLVGQGDNLISIRGFDYAIDYNNYESNFDGDLEIPAKTSVIISFWNTDIDIYFPRGLYKNGIEVMASEREALKYIGGKDEPNNYKIKNLIADKMVFKNNASPMKTFDYSINYNDYESEFFGQLTLPQASSAVISFNNKDIKIYFPKDLSENGIIQVATSDKEALKYIEIEKDESYRIKNKMDTMVLKNNGGPTRTYDYAIDRNNYDSNVYEDITLPRDNNVLVTARRDEFKLYYPMDLDNRWIETQGPLKDKIRIKIGEEEREEEIRALYYGKMDENESYRIENLINYDIDIKNNNNDWSTKRYNYVINYINYESTFSQNLISLAKHSTMVLTSKDKDFWVYFPMELLKNQELKVEKIGEDEKEDKALHTIKVGRGESYKIKNRGNPISLKNNSTLDRKYDYAINHSDYESNFYGELNLPEEGTAIVTARDWDLEIYIPKKYYDKQTITEEKITKKEDEEEIKEALKYTAMEKGKNYKITNRGSPISLKNNSTIDRRYDYAIDHSNYESDFYGQLNLPSEASAIISPVGEEDIVFYFPDGQIEVEENKAPALYYLIIGEGEEEGISNLSASLTIDIKNKSNDNRQYNYTMVDGNGNITNGSNISGNLTLPAKGKVEVSGVSGGDIRFEFPYELYRKKIITTDEYEIHARKNISDETHEWTIEFNKDLDQSIENKEKAYIEDNEGNRLDFIVSQIEANKIRLINKASFEKDTIYYIIVEKRIKSEDGQILKKGIRKPFKVE